MLKQLDRVAECISVVFIDKHGCPGALKLSYLGWRCPGTETRNLDDTG